MIDEFDLQAPKQFFVKAAELICCFYIFIYFVVPFFVNNDTLQSGGAECVCSSFSPAESDVQTNRSPP